ncbi:hypothetical protein Tco_0967464 [Tanacetum coccineum]
MSLMTQESSLICADAYAVVVSGVHGDASSVNLVLTYPTVIGAFSGTASAGFPKADSGSGISSLQVNRWWMYRDGVVEVRWGHVPNKAIPAEGLWKPEEPRVNASPNTNVKWRVVINRKVNGYSSAGNSWSSSNGIYSGATVCIGSPSYPNMMTRGMPPSDISSSSAPQKALSGSESV